MTSCTTALTCLGVLALAGRMGLPAATPSLHTVIPHPGGGVEVGWSGDAGGWTLERSIDQRAYVTVGLITGAGTQVDATAPAGQLLTYRLRQGRSCSNWNYLFTPGPVAAAPAPSPVCARFLSATTVLLTWDDRFADETGFEIQRKASGALGFVTVATAPAGTISWQDATVDWSGSWSYRVRARGGSGDSPWSLEVPATVIGDHEHLALPTFAFEAVYAPVPKVQAILAVPQGLTATPIQATRVDLAWSVVPGAVGYSVLESWDGIRYAEVAQVATSAFIHAGVLLPQHARHYRVAARDAGGMGPWSAAVIVTPAVFAADLIAPVSTTAQATGDGIRITWSDNAADETGFAIERAGCTTPHFARIATVVAGITTWTDPAGLASDQYRVQVLRGAACSAYGPVAIAPGPGELPAVTGLHATPTSAATVELGWSAVTSGYPNGYAIERDDGAGFQGVGWVARPATTWIDRSVPPLATAAYRIRATGYIEAWAPSSAVTVQIPAVTAAPAAPDDLVATVLGPDQVDLSWRDRATSETGFLVEQKIGSGAFAPIASLPANGRNLTATGLPAGVACSWRVSAVNGCGSAVSATVTATPGGTPGTVAMGVHSAGHVRRLTITGSAVADRIVVRQQGQDVIVNVGGVDRPAQTGPFDEIVVQGQMGDDDILIETSVAVRCLLYGGRGDDVLTHLGTGRGVIVALGGDRDSIRGNGLDSSYWVDTASIDSVAASSREVQAGRIHRIGAFYQPATSDPVQAAFVDITLNGQSWSDPGAWDGSGSLRFTGASLWGRRGPVLFDVNQGAYQNCGDTAFWQLVADRRPDLAEDVLCDLGDGTYAYRMDGSGTCARIDGDLNPSQYSAPGASGSLWWPLMEKAIFAYGLPAALGDQQAEVLPVQGDGEAVYARIRAALDACRLILIRNEGERNSGAPLVAQGHAYGIVEAFRAADGTPRFILRNPYGSHACSLDLPFTGCSYNHDWAVPLKDQGLVTLTLDALQSNFASGTASRLPGTTRMLWLQALTGHEWQLDDGVVAPLREGGADVFDLQDERLDHVLRPVGTAEE